MKEREILRVFCLSAIAVVLLIFGTSIGKCQTSDELSALLHDLRSNHLGRSEASHTILRKYALLYNIAVDSLRERTDSLYTYSLARLVLAQALHEQGDYTNSTQLCNGVINYFYDRQDTVYAFTSLVLQSANFIQLGLSADAVPLIVKSQALASSAADSVLQVRALSMMGALYLSVDKPDASMVYITEAIEQCRQIRTEFHDKLLTDLLCLQCEAYLQQGNGEQGLVALTEAIEMSDANEVWQLRSKTRRLLGDVYLALKRFPKAEQTYLEALYFSQQEVNLTQRVYVLRQLGELRALQKRYNDALVYNAHALHLSDSLGLAGLQRSILWQRYQFTREQNPPEALLNLERYIHLGDSLVNSAIQTKLSVLHERYERQLREQQIQVQQLQISRDRYAKLILGASIFLLFILSGLLFWLTRQRKKRLRYMEEINLSKNRFFSIISHDAKNHAIAIQMVLGQLLTYYSSLSLEQIKEFLVQLKTAADMQIEFLLNLLNWARLQLNAIPYLPVQFHLIELVRKNASFFTLSLSNKSLQLVVDCPEEIEIYADRDMVDVILRNLLSNAIKFSHPNTMIDIIVSQQQYGVSLQVRDRGLGMTSEQIAKIGRIEQRMLNTGTRGEKGSGLGLILCMSLARTNGARIEVESEGQGKGTSITVLFETSRRK